MTQAQARSLKVGDWIARRGGCCAHRIYGLVSQYEQRSLQRVPLDFDGAPTGMTHLVTSGSRMTDGGVLTESRSFGEYEGGWNSDVVTWSQLRQYEVVEDPFGGEAS